MDGDVVVANDDVDVVDNDDALLNNGRLKELARWL